MYVIAIEYMAGLYYIFFVKNNLNYISGNGLTDFRLCSKVDSFFEGEASDEFVDHFYSCLYYWV